MLPYMISDALKRPNFNFSVTSDQTLGITFHHAVAKTSLLRTQIIHEYRDFTPRPKLDMLCSTVKPVCNDHF